MDKLGQGKLVAPSDASKDQEGRSHASGWEEPRVQEMALRLPCSFRKQVKMTPRKGL